MHIQLVDLVVRRISCFIDRSTMQAEFIRIILLLGALTGAAAGSEVARSQDFTFEPVTSVTDGPMATFIVDVVQDKSGFMWFATDRGLYKYDGYRTTVYLHEEGNSTSLSADRLEALHVDSSGRLWVGTQGGGLNRFEPDSETFTRYRHNAGNPQSLGHDSVNVILEDRLGALWVGTPEGLHKFDRESETFTHYGHDPTDPSSLSHADVRVLYEDRRGTLWVGTGNPNDDPLEGGLNRFDRSTESFVRYRPDPADPSALIDGRVSALLEDSQGHFWVGTWGNGLHRMDRRSGAFTRHRYDPDDPTKLSRPYPAGTVRTNEGCVGFGTACGGVTAIHEDRDGILWIGALHGGLNAYDPQSGRVVHVEHDADTPSGLSANTVWTIYESRDETLWVGTWGGLNRRVTPSVRLPRVDLPGSNGFVYAIWEDSEGALWIGTDEGGLRHIDRASGRQTAYQHEPDAPTTLSSNIVDAIFEDRSGMIWVGTHGGGLNRFDRERASFTHFRHDASESSSLGSDIVHDIFQDAQGSMWVGTTQGLSVMHPGRSTFTRYRHDPDDPTSLSHDSVHDILQDADGQLWITTQGGLNRFEPETDTFRRYTSEPGNPNTFVSNHLTGILADRSGILWVGSDRGLERFDPKTGAVTHLSPRGSGLTYGGISGILEDDNGILWTVAGHSSSVMRLNPRENTFHVFSDHLESTDFISRDDAVHRGEQGTLYIGTTNGYYAFAPEAVDEQRNLHPPQVALSTFYLFNQVVRPGSDAPLRESLSTARAIELAHNQNSFAFDFAGLHYADSQENQHVYRLEPYDTDWRTAGVPPSASYYDVPPGEYVFTVKAANRDGVWSEEGASIRVSVLPPWWKTGWAYSFYALLVIGAVVGAARLQRKRILRQEEERSRQRELEHARKIEGMNRRLREHEHRLTRQNALLEDQKAELEHHRERLLELDAMKSRFFANISHEFRTPLTLIGGPLRDLLEGRFGELDTRQRDALRLMYRSNERLLGLINQLLDLSKLESGGMQLSLTRTDLVEFLRGIMLAFSGRSERDNIGMTFAPSLESMPFVFDPDKLEKVVTNLLSNAFKFTPSGGKIHVGLTRDNESAVISVKDTGRGIPAEELPHIFDRFYQVDGSQAREHEGTGIGLALTKELVELHDGTITVESEGGFGTSFIIRIPMRTSVGVKGDPPNGPPLTGVADLTDVRSSLAENDLHMSAPEDDEERASAPKGAPLVLIVDDNADLRAYLRSHLDAQYRVVEATNGAEGLEAAKTQRPDLVIADVMMPKVDGITLCKQLKSDPDLAEVPVVILTAKATPEDKLEGLEIGADDYLIKPFSADELLARAENLIELRRRLRRHYSDEVRIGPSEISVPSDDAAFLERTRDVIEAHMSDHNFTGDWLADEVGMSRRNLHRKLRDLVDLSPAAYIRMMRLERAAQLLEQEAGLVSEVAYKVGFKNADHFSRVFGQVFGVPPSEYPPESR